MFFYIGKESPIASLTQVQENLFLDQGWSEINGIWYKGYSTDCRLSDALVDIVNGYKPDGKWCLIKDGVVYHPSLRGFPVFTNGLDLTNLLGLPNFELVMYPIIFELPTVDSHISLEEASHQLEEILISNTRNFYKYNDIVDEVVIASAGLDSTTAWAVTDFIKKDYTVSIHPRAVPTVIDANAHLEFMGTVREYHSDLLDNVKSHWAYAFINLHKNKNWVFAGYYAETYEFRDGMALNALANYKNKRLDEIAEPNNYLYNYLTRPDIINSYIDKPMMTFSSEEDLRKYIWSTLWYDHQMWHIDNNMFFSPFFDIRVPQITFRMSMDDIYTNALEGTLQRQIISRCKPELLSIVSKYKNHGEVWENFNDNFSLDWFSPETKIIIR
jgi:hypothetical protein